MGAPGAPPASPPASPPPPPPRLARGVPVHGGRFGEADGRDAAARPPAHANGSLSGDSHHSAASRGSHPSSDDDNTALLRQAAIDAAARNHRCEVGARVLHARVVLLFAARSVTQHPFSRIVTQRPECQLSDDEVAPPSLRRQRAHTRVEVVYPPVEQSVHALPAGYACSASRASLRFSTFRAAAVVHLCL